MLQLVEVTDSAGRIAQPEWLARAETVHRQLRPKLPADYTGKMRRVFAGGGRMLIAADGEAVVGVAIWRVYENTFAGMQMYVDDLVTDETRRSSGVGHALMEALQGMARALGCESYSLDSGTQRQQAHKFYFRENMVVTAFHFDKKL
jgi:hypothetical protein